jgi:GNAT superfamily N-acetyltransferase
VEGVDSIEIGRLRETDIAEALQLKEQENWNQTESDFRRLMRLDPRGCLAARLGGRVVGTVTSVIFGKGLAWIGMMLVDKGFRRRGLGKRLMRAALDYLGQEGVDTVKLDATAAGRPVYESLGFVPESLIERWERVPPDTDGPGQAASRWPGIDEHTWPAVCALDRPAFGADRTQVLRSLICDSCVEPLVHMAEAGCRGFALARAGHKAFYLGPVIATDGRVAIKLIDGMLEEMSGEPVYVDFNATFETGSKPLTERGFVKQRDLVRMRYGKASGAGTSSLVFAIAGPELG